MVPGEVPALQLQAARTQFTEKTFGYRRDRKKPRGREFVTQTLTLF
jgi:hypothetical protein